MCDEQTEAELFRALADAPLSRRDFAGLGLSATMAMTLAGCAGVGGAKAARAELAEDAVRFTAAGGMADGFLVHPARGRHPGVILWPDIAGLRETKKIMARRLAAEGYAVLVFNQYWRGGPAPLFSSFADWRTPEGQARIKVLRDQLTPAAVTSDAAACAAFLDGSRAVDRKRRIGAMGYCMGGPFAVRTAAAVPARVGAAASFHGGELVTQAADSPHRLLASTRAGFLFAIGRGDDERAPGDKDALRQAAESARRQAEVEVYPADHGWCVPDHPLYDPVQADRAWQRLLALFAGL